MAPQSGASWGWFQPSSNPDTATAQTVSFMCGLVAGAAKSPAVQAIAQDAVERFGPLGSYDPAANESVETGAPWSAGYLARAVFWYARFIIGRLHHDEFKAMVSAFPEKKQLLIAPDALLLSDAPHGDCSAFTMAICALLRCLGVGYEMIAVAASPADPSLYTHVYPRAILESGARLPLDAHAGDAPGWEVPKQDVFRKQVYDASGAPVSDKQQSSFKGLHYYSGRGLGDTCQSYDDDGNCLLYDSSSTSLGTEDCAFGPAVDGICPSASASQVSSANTQLNSILSSGVLSSGSSSGSSSSSSSSGSNAIDSGIMSLLNTWSKIGGQVVAPTTTVVGANGQMISTPSSSLWALSASGLLGNLSSSGSSSMWLLLLVGLGAVLIFSGKK
jgi:hypothetical protein